jgi:hypothetical protein
LLIKTLAGEQIVRVHEQDGLAERYGERIVDARRLVGIVTDPDN